MNYYFCLNLIFSFVIDYEQCVSFYDSLVAFQAMLFYISWLFRTQLNHLSYSNWKTVIPCCACFMYYAFNYVVLKHAICIINSIIY